MRRAVTKPCSVDGCDRFAVSWRADYCRRHGYHFERYGDPIPRVKSSVCVVCAGEFMQSRHDQMTCGAPECRQARNRETTREGDRRYRETHGEWRRIVAERDNPDRVESRRAADRERDAAMDPVKKREQRREKDDRRRARKIATAVEPFTRAEVYDRDGWVCQLCLEPVDAGLEYPDPMSKSLDHRVPLARGGTHSFDNCQLAHLSCNVAKSDKVA